MARNDPTIYMRIPQELKDALDKASEENRRSLTAEVVSRLQSTFAATSHGVMPPMGGGASARSASTDQELESLPANLSRALEELESLQLLGTLNYRLQRAHSQADSVDRHFRAGWNELQDAIKQGNKEEQQRVNDALSALRAQKNEITKTIEDIDAQISEIHLQRKASNMRELRDVQPLHADFRFGSPGDREAVAPTPQSTGEGPTRSANAPKPPPKKK